MASRDLVKFVVRLTPGKGNYYYYRRVPKEVAHLDTRTHVRQTLRTDDLREALSRGETIHDATEKLWQSLSAGEKTKTPFEQYAAAVKIAQSIGFTYKSVGDVARFDLQELNTRILLAQEAYGKSDAVINAALGAAPVPSPRLSNLWSLYEEHNEDGLTGMSKRQMSKHKVSRERAITYATEVLGDMDLGKITRPDVLRFRDWWTKKVKKESLRAYTANRSFSDLKGMIGVIDTALHTDFRKAWEESRLKETNATKLRKRRPFPHEWVREKMLAENALQILNDDARAIVYIMIETGMRLGEVCNLRPQDIYLDDEVPHVEVAERDDRRQKTDYSIRRVPLVGVALWAMKQHPEGFPRYQDKADTASATINKALSSLELRPTKLHTVYSFRHSFQDRIENAETSDRMQADLMGHEFGRPTYGDGAEMKRRQTLLERIRFHPAWLDGSVESAQGEPEEDNP